MSVHPLTKRSPAARQDHRQDQRRASGVQAREQCIGDQSLCRLLVDALDERFVGTLQLIDDIERAHYIVFDLGVPCQVGTPLTIEPFDKTLLRLGFTGELVDHAALDAAMRVRVMLFVERLFALSPHTRYRWIPHVDVVAHDQHACNALALLMRGLRRLAASDDAQRMLDDLQHRPLILRDDATPRQVGLTRTECAVIEALGREVLTLEQLCQKGLGPPPVVRAAIYGFSVLRFFAHESAGPPVSMPQSMRGLMPKPRPPGHGALDNDPFARAEVLFRKRSYDAAEQVLRELVRDKPEHLGAKALLAWLRAERLGPPPHLLFGQTTSMYAEPLQMLDEVVHNNPMLERGRYWRGVLLQRSGHWHRAVGDFRAVLRLNPRNVGAEREVQRFDTIMRQLHKKRWRAP